MDKDGKDCGMDCEWKRAMRQMAMADTQCGNAHSLRPYKDNRSTENRCDVLHLPLTEADQGLLGEEPMEESQRNVQLRRSRIQSLQADLSTEMSWELEQLSPMEYKGILERLQLAFGDCQVEQGKLETRLATSGLPAGSDVEREIGWLNMWLGLVKDSLSAAATFLWPTPPSDEPKERVKCLQKAMGRLLKCSEQIDHIDGMSWLTTIGHNRGVDNADTTPSETDGAKGLDQLTPVDEIPKGGNDSVD